MPRPERQKLFEYFTQVKGSSGPNGETEDGSLDQLLRVITTLLVIISYADPNQHNLNPAPRFS